MLTRVLAALIASALVCGAGVAHAAPRWTVPQAIPSDDPHDWVQVGDGSGTRLLAFRDSRGVHLTLARRGRGYGKPRRITRNATTEDVYAVMNRRGEAVIAWSEFDNSRPSRDTHDYGCCIRLHAVVMRRNGRLGRPSTLSPPRVDVLGPPYLAAAADGKLGVVWDRYARFGSIERGFGRLERPRALGDPLGVAFDRRGRARIVDEFSTDSMYAFQVREIVRRGMGKYSRPRVLASDDGRDSLFGYSPFGFDDRDRQVSIWYRARSSEESIGVATRTPPGPLRSRTLFSHQFLAGPPMLDVSGSGAAIVAWGYRPTREAHPYFVVTVRGPRGGFGEPVTIYRSPPPNDPEADHEELNDVAVAPGGGSAVGLRAELPTVLLLDRQGRVRGTKVLPSTGIGTLLDVYADSRGTSAVWGGWDGFRAARTR